MRQLGIDFDEVALRFDFGPDSPFRRAVARISPAGRVPVLVDDGFAVWDSLAIVETLHEKFPGHGVWPADARQRARARSLCAEMHSGFAALREHCPMNIEASLAEAGARLWAGQPQLRRDVERIDRLWGDALRDSGGPMLFGRFSAADAFFAPVCMRLLTYALQVGPASAAYVAAVAALPAVQAWCAAARAEHDYVAEDDPYRPAPS
jgi:glutathione S-transferase